ncbi:hypothetical protein K2173_024708 [Erythroxylum novogranatense]|uniref:Uncharacterized protein n=1 Tax=Erythroxylum novogranatense TaxID=1862640 RepID=A0AAV8SV39_9ROSI|nr:hypothetical protein K2173_024708 [Erythroxylum novogranatense]
MLYVLRSQVVFFSSSLLKIKSSSGKVRKESFSGSMIPESQKALRRRDPMWILGMFSPSRDLTRAVDK